MDTNHSNVRLGIVGTGFISQGLTAILLQTQHYQITKVRTRLPISLSHHFPRHDLLTNSTEELLDHCDILVECSGDPLHATEIVDLAMQRGLAVVTMNPEFQVTTGSWFVERGLLTEAEGDQPGCLAALHDEARRMGFRPWVYGNRKGFLNHTPDSATMRHWAAKQRIRLEQVIANTDGTKVQIEQALVANGLGADIAKPGLLGPAPECVRESAIEMAEFAKSRSTPLADYFLAPGTPWDVFLVAEHQACHGAALQYFRMGEGPFYILPRTQHLCYLEICKTIHRILSGQGPLLNNSPMPRISIAAIAKKPLQRGRRIRRGLGSFDVRGETVRIREQPEHAPIGLLFNAVLRRAVEPGQMLCLDDVELPDSLALRIWHKLVARVSPEDNKKLHRQRFAKNTVLSIS